jgi:hypothetical protein
MKIARYAGRVASPGPPTRILHGGVGACEGVPQDARFRVLGGDLPRSIAQQQQFACCGADAETTRLGAKLIQSYELLFNWESESHLCNGLQIRWDGAENSLRPICFEILV